jgi:predicted acyltransferase
MQQTLEESVMEKSSVIPPAKITGRLLSLDVFRGITIAGMVLVNNPGTWSAIYPPLEHAEWNGCTPTDTIFPFFLFIVGVAIPFALGKRIERGDGHKKIILQIIKRSIILFLLGLILAAFPFGLFGHHLDLSTIRIMGVLQRISVVYLIAAIMFLKTNYKAQIYIGAILLIVYAILMTLVPVPGVGHPSLEPATNLGAWLDRTVLGNHLWAQSKVWDPEGILSTMPAIVTAIMGMITGWWLRLQDKDKTTKTVWLFVIGSVCMTLGYIWDAWFPINKSLWTSSYVLYTGGLALLFLGFCYWFIDVKNSRWWIRPFQVYGLNAITVFFLSGLVGRLLYTIKVPYGGEQVGLGTYLFNNLFIPWLNPINASLAWAICYVIIWLGLMWILYAKKIFIKI